MIFRGVTMECCGGCRGRFDGTTRGMPGTPHGAPLPWGCDGDAMVSHG